MFAVLFVIVLLWICSWFYQILVLGYILLSIAAVVMVRLHLKQLQAMDTVKAQRCCEAELPPIMTVEAKPWGVSAWMEVVAEMFSCWRKNQKTNLWEFMAQFSMEGLMWLVSCAKELNEWTGRMLVTVSAHLAVWDAVCDVALHEKARLGFQELEYQPEADKGSFWAPDNMPSNIA
ncbi:hypothetical protein CISG_00745 [Coccidioides immitis RMSCC 3703]|uniref:Uncharacterized protein n=1 Tax=Coccidioides immitis RMSCC 3703 TaxID=454286 RepID=A0A0J8QRU9_COCIT|nr:hypothetical protein CISG_00745 [Coccidioides immitis RMSCC 3703]